MWLGCYFFELGSDKKKKRRHTLTCTSTHCCAKSHRMACKVFKTKDLGNKRVPQNVVRLSAGQRYWLFATANKPCFSLLVNCLRTATSPNGSLLITGGCTNWANWPQKPRKRLEWLCFCFSAEWRRRQRDRQHGPNTTHYLYQHWAKTGSRLHHLGDPNDHLTRRSQIVGQRHANKTRMWCCGAVSEWVCVCVWLIGSPSKNKTTKMLAKNTKLVGQLFCC